MIELSAKHFVPKVIDPRRVFAEKEGFEFANGGDDGVGLAFEDGFAPPGKPFVGFNLEKDPAGWNFVEIESCDFHVGLLGSVLKTVPKKISTQ